MRYVGVVLQLRFLDGICMVVCFNNDYIVVDVWSFIDVV